MPRDPLSVCREKEQRGVVDAKEGVSKETVVQFASEKERAPGW